MPGNGMENAVIRLPRLRSSPPMAGFLASDLAGYVTGTAINVNGNLCPVM